MKNVLVFFGGVSVEHDISVITGVLTLNSIDRMVYTPVPVYIDRDGKWYTGKTLCDISVYKNLNLKKLSAVTMFAGDNALYKVARGRYTKLIEADCILNCIHGVCGEDGALAGFAKMCPVAFCSPDMYPSSLAMDKHFTKQALSSVGVRFLPDICIERRDYYNRADEIISCAEEKFSYPMIVKPSSLGSSIGITVCKDREKLKSAFDLAFSYDGKVIVEKALVGCMEINCAAYKSDGEIIVSECEQPITKDDILSFKDKYLNYKNGADKKFPADIPQKISEEIKRITRLVYSEFCFRGVIRVDFLVDGDEVYINELNTVPGSLAYYLFCRSMKEFSAMLDGIIRQGIADFEESRKVNRDFYSSVLNIEKIKGKK